MDSIPLLSLPNLNCIPESDLEEEEKFNPTISSNSPNYPKNSKPIMGGCASRPKEFDTPVEAPISSDNSQHETAAQGNSNGGEGQIEKPLADLSEPEKEAQVSSSEAVAAVMDVAEIVKPAEDDVKAVEVSNNTTELRVKEAEADHKSNDAPSKEEVKK